jgi:hypothetical protein
MIEVAVGLSELPDDRAAPSTLCSGLLTLAPVIVITPSARPSLAQVLATPALSRRTRSPIVYSIDDVKLA